MATIFFNYSINTSSKRFAWLCYIVTYVDSHLHTCTYICRIIHSDTTIKTHEGRRRKKRSRKTSLQIYLPLPLFVSVSKRVVQGLHVRGCWRPNINFIFWSPLLMAVPLCLSCSLRCSTGAVGSTLLDAGFLYCILSASSLDPELHRGFRVPLRLGVASPTTSGL